MTNNKEAESADGELTGRITDYLSSGGLCNPEMMEHGKVRDLLIDCREALAVHATKPEGRALTFASWWASMEAKGYQYGSDALENVRMGYEAAQALSDGGGEQNRAYALAAAIHYPDCWDNAAYPTLESALSELFAYFECSNQDDQHLSDESEELRRALTELVALKDLKDRLQQLQEMGHDTDYGDYHRRQPLAWETARQALAHYRRST